MTLVISRLSGLAQVSKWSLSGLGRRFDSIRGLATKDINSVEEFVQERSSADVEISVGRSNGRFSSKVLGLAREGIEQGKAHFRVGERELYFPKARIILLRPNAKHTPYQAKFIVPKSFNKLDLRDYLFHIYGLRAMNVTTQLLHGKFTRFNIGSPRYRSPQIKKMTIDMAEPFIWPEEPLKKENSLWDDSIVKELEKFREENVMKSIGSDKFKPGTAFEGSLGPYKEVAQPFVPRMLKNKFSNQQKNYKLRLNRMQNLIKLQKYVNN